MVAAKQVALARFMLQAVEHTEQKRIGNQSELMEVFHKFHSCCQIEEGLQRKGFGLIEDFDHMMQC